MNTQSLWMGAFDVAAKVVDTGVRILTDLKLIRQENGTVYAENSFGDEFEMPVKSWEAMHNLEKDRSRTHETVVQLVAEKPKKTKDQSGLKTVSTKAILTDGHKNNMFLNVKDDGDGHYIEVTGKLYIDNTKQTSRLKKDIDKLLKQFDES